MMTFEETLDFLRHQEGRTVEIGVALPRHGDEEPFLVASVSGRVERVAVGGGSAAPDAGDLWRVWLESGLGDQITLHRRLFESAEVVADQPPPEERNQTGTTWTLTIRQAGVVFDVLIYV
jgi:hypothetical protein